MFWAKISFNNCSTSSDECMSELYWSDKFIQVPGSLYEAKSHFAYEERNIVYFSNIFQNTKNQVCDRYTSTKIMFIRFVKLCVTRDLLFHNYKLVSAFVFI